MNESLEQSRLLRTPLPGPRSQELMARKVAAVSQGVATTLPVPAEAVFQIPELPHPTAETVALLAPPEPRPAASASGAIFRHGKPEHSHGKQAAKTRKPGRAASTTTGRGAQLKHFVQDKQRNA